MCVSTFIVYLKKTREDQGLIHINKKEMGYPESPRAYPAVRQKGQERTPPPCSVPRERGILLCKRRPPTRPAPHRCCADPFTRSAYLLPIGYSFPCTHGSSSHLISSSPPLKATLINGFTSPLATIHTTSPFLFLRSPSFFYPSLVSCPLSLKNLLWLFKETPSDQSILCELVFLHWFLSMGA